MERSVKESSDSIISHRSLLPPTVDEESKHKEMDISRSSNRGQRRSRRDMDTSSGMNHSSKRDMDVSRRSNDFIPVTPIRSLSNKYEEQDQQLRRQRPAHHNAYGRQGDYYTDHSYSRNYPRDGTYAYQDHPSRPGRENRSSAFSAPRRSEGFNYPSQPTHRREDHSHPSQYHQPQESAYYHSDDGNYEYNRERDYPESRAQRVTPTPFEDEPDLNPIDQYQSQEAVMVEIEPGTRVPLRPASETMGAVATHNYRRVTCLACCSDLYCISDCQYYICPHCMVITSASANSFYSKGDSVGSDNRRGRYGLGLGFTEDGLMQIYHDLQYRR